MRRAWVFLACCAFLALAVPGRDAAAQTLPIPPRLQWDDNNGYCGETSIQQIALYYGTYVSQYRAREIIDPSQRTDVLIDENNGPVLDALRLTYEYWSHSVREPQYKKFLLWVKQHIHSGHPVIMAVYYNDSEDWNEDYDHIVPAVGVRSSSWSRYLGADKLVFHDNYTRRSFTRRFSRMWDDRDMEGNGWDYEFCVPKYQDYGCAVTGVRDELGETRPVRLEIDRWDEPNLIHGEAAQVLHAAGTVSGLTPGQSYLLLRYDNYGAVPARDFASSGGYTWALNFTASGDTYSFGDEFLSDGVVIYRCVAAGGS